MAAANVGGLCVPTALALKHAGLEYILFDATQARAIRDSAREMARQPEGPPTRVFQSPSTAQAQRHPTRDARKKNGHAPSSGSSPHPEEQAPQAVPDPGAWPGAWRECLKKTRIAPVVWTYWELGQDLCGAPDPKRREFLRELLKDLAHPPGTHSFWPLALPVQNGDGGQQLEANASVFWEGVELLCARAVMIMGSQTLRSLALPNYMLKMRPFQQLHHQGRLFIVLHSPDMLVREKQRIQPLREFLRQALTPFV